MESRSAIFKAVAVLVTVAALVASAVWMGLRSAGSDHASVGAMGIDGDVAGSAKVAPSSTPKDGVRLPEGADTAQGYSVRFPYTDLGAVAASVAVARAQVGFDYDQAATVAGIYASAEDRATFEARSTAAVQARRSEAGIPTNGNIPPPAAYAMTPIAFTIEELATDYYAVNVLSYYTLSTTDGTTRDALYSGTQLLRWQDDDWKLVRGNPDEHRELIEGGLPAAAAPGSAAFERAGWIRLDGAQP